MERQSLPDRFYAWLIAQERRSRLTAETYRFEVRLFLNWLGNEGLSPEALELSDISRYLDYRRHNDGIDSRSVAKAISALRSFFRFLEDEGICSDNCAVLLEAPRGTSRLPTVLSRGEIEKMFSLIDTGTLLGIRNRALYELIYSSGIRISEAVSLNTQDVFLSRGMARVLGKGDKERLVIYGPEAASWVKRYTEDVRPEFLGKRRSSALFLGRNGKRLSRKGIWKNYAALAALAGISSKVHTLRHTFATDLLAGGADLRSVQELLGHSDLATTQVYTHLDKSFLEENHQRYLPRLKQWKEYES